MRMKHYHWLLISFIFMTTISKGQYDPSKIFVTDLYKYKGDDLRSASGKPGNAYWQNEANYTIKASFDVTSHRLEGNVEIDYTNNSPDVLDALWLQLDQNTLKPDARGNMLQNPTMAIDDSKGYELSKIQIKKNGSWEEISFLEDDTRLQIRLEKALQPGEKVALSIDYAYTLEEKGGGGRSGILESENGEVFEFSYWYPRMCVYDDYYGWNTLPFIGGGEMYLDYGTIDYELTVPSDQVVVSSGVLVNETDILNKTTLDRLSKARKSDETVFIRGIDEVDKPVTKEKKGNVTWHFKMENTRDVAWAMSSAFVWDAAKINLEDGKTALAQSVYPVESTKEGRGWARSTEMLKASVEDFSTKWFAYPYPSATCVGGKVGGMEFPGLAFNYWDIQPAIVYLLASHEIGHTWYPMIVGSDERRHPFMDEGFNTFMDVYAQEDFNKGEFAPKRDGEYAPGGGNPADEIIQVIEDCKNGPTIMTFADDMDYKYVHPLGYFKTAFGLVLLREVVLGPDKFDYAFRQYTQDWAYKHPKPEDFFRAMENGSGEDLMWFWNGWFYHNWQLDQAIKSVEYVDKDPAKGAIITVTNNQQMVMPILVKIEEENGKVQNLKVPIEIWKFGGEATFTVGTTSKIKKVELDSEHQLPDIDRSNNVWEP